jgi:2-polyprenyl-6-methoxyphenol hydroxylase-like FAD-dependent oxidoreductase
LTKLIFHSLEGTCETIFGDSISYIEQKNCGVRVGFERGPTRDFDLVIGADGLHSVVRRLVFGPQERFETYLGYAVAAFEVSGYRLRDEGIYVCYSLPGKQVARFAMREDRTLFLFVFAAEHMPFPDPHDTCAHKAILRNEFGGAGWECAQILEGLDRCKDLYFDRVSQIKMPSWTHGRIALVGDAAFCPSLLAGQGAALAMTAAYVLAGELADAPERVGYASNRYEAVLGAFMAGKQEAARRFARSFVPRTRVGLFVRNQICKTFRIPLMANLVLGYGLLDRLELPDYPE